VLARHLRCRARTWKLLSFHPGFFANVRTMSSASTASASPASIHGRSVSSKAARRSFQFALARPSRAPEGRTPGAWASASSWVSRYLSGSTAAALGATLEVEAVGAAATGFLAGGAAAVCARHRALKSSSKATKTHGCSRRSLDGRSSGLDRRPGPGARGRGSLFVNVGDGGEDTLGGL
jgi:hypothetical protein